MKYIRKWPKLEKVDKPIALPFVSLELVSDVPGAAEHVVTRGELRSNERGELETHIFEEDP